MRLYLDLNCFNRPFDDQTQARIAIETEAVYAVLQRIVDGRDELVWSWALEFENSRHPMIDRRMEIENWSHMSVLTVASSDVVTERATNLVALGIKALDAAHVACAEAAICDRLLTCDDRLLNSARRTLGTEFVQNPTKFLAEFANE